MSDEALASLRGEFLLESQERLGRLEDLLLAIADGDEADPEAVAEIKLQLHTLKGNSGVMGLRELQSLAHELEDLAEHLGAGAPETAELLQGLDRFRGLLRREMGDGDAEKAGPDSGDRGRDASVRVAFSALDVLVDLLGEVVIHRNHLADALGRHRRELGTAGARREGFEAVQRASELLVGTLDRVREGVMGLRMVPLRTLFRSLARIVYDESNYTGKQARFETRGGDTPLDKALLELSSEALGHLVRNAVIHGLESPEERRQSGKAESGLIRLSAEADAREVRIDVLDDGRGIRKDTIAAEAARRGRDLSAGEDPFSLLFQPGFSTLQSADLSAGRGVGLAAVREAVARRGGRVEVFSEEGAGTLFRLRLPLSVSIARVLLLASDGEEYVLPLFSVVESVELTPAKVNEINGALVLSWRGGLIPLVDLGHCFGTSAVRRRAGRAVVIEVRGEFRAVAVDRIHGIREVVVRDLDELAGEHPGVAGTTILGDGRAVLILDALGLMELSPFATSPVSGRPA
jgi:two-component system, chemotaxis family, sensor kinase CheA